MQMEKRDLWTQWGKRVGLAECSIDIYLHYVYSSKQIVNGKLLHGTRSRLAPFNDPEGWGGVRGGRLQGEGIDM